MLLAWARRALYRRKRAPSCGAKVDWDYGEQDDPCGLLFHLGHDWQDESYMLSNDYLIRLARWYINQGGTAATRKAEDVILTPLPLFCMNALSDYRLVSRA